MTGMRLKAIRNKYFALIVIVISTICYSCSNEEVYYSFFELKKSEWTKSDTMYFNVDSVLLKNDVPYTVSIEIVNNADYPYQNIWFFINDNINNPIFDTTAVQYMLADKFGRWHGSGFGSTYQLSLHYKDTVFFKEKRDYCIKIVHGMRDEPLKGIEKIGIRIKESD